MSAPAPTLPLDLTYHETRALAKLVATTVGKLERQYRKPHAEAKRLAAGVGVTGRDVALWKIEQTHTLLRKLRVLEDQYQKELS